MDSSGKGAGTVGGGSTARGLKWLATSVVNSAASVTVAPLSENPKLYTGMYGGVELGGLAVGAMYCFFGGMSYQDYYSVLGAQCRNLIKKPLVLYWLLDGDPIMLGFGTRGLLIKFLQ